MDFTRKPTLSIHGGFTFIILIFFAVFEQKFHNSHILKERADVESNTSESESCNSLLRLPQSSPFPHIISPPFSGTIVNTPSISVPISPWQRSWCSVLAMAPATCWRRLYFHVTRLHGPDRPTFVHGALARQKYRWCSPLHLRKRFVPR